MQVLVGLIALLAFGAVIWLAIEIQQGVEGWFGVLFRGSDAAGRDASLSRSSPVFWSGCSSTG